MAKRINFNFNNDVDTFEILQEEDGRIIVPGEDGPIAEYDNIQQFAEMYAQCRDVKPEHLKNWTLVENGDVVSFVLRAGTAGVSAADIEDQLNAVFAEMRQSGEFHPLEVERCRNEVATADNIMTALAMSSVGNVARKVYDRLAEMGAFEEPEPEPVEVDDRSEMERFLDGVMECDKTLAFFARLLHLDVAAAKDEILEAISTSSIPYTADMLRTLYNDALRAAMTDGINVTNRFEAVLVVTQAVPGGSEDNDKKKNQIVMSTKLAGRNKANVVVYEVGQHHILKTASLVSLEDLAGETVYVVNNVPTIVTFDAAVDEELEAERAAAEAEAARSASSLSYDEDEEDEDEDYDYDEDEYDEDEF